MPGSAHLGGVGSEQQRPQHRPLGVCLLRQQQMVRCTHARGLIGAVNAWMLVAEHKKKLCLLGLPQRAPYRSGAHTCQLANVTVAVCTSTIAAP